MVHGGGGNHSPDSSGTSVPALGRVKKILITQLTKVEHERHPSETTVQEPVFLYVTR